eukprot:CAMPEP_0196573390 /NCGR_PEP_ID=MMETSP1081-20130531/3299_1 /TAXON_ID=36882 /ORGANISM="Pyramimonas amylifera, Strain CCMP720" /LENGTH=267 /DNA_ID=CAMNT_0041891073 /DNA_START=198 /DNA_END=1001 /DNA_ORIENTATION=+
MKMLPDDNTNHHHASICSDYSKSNLDSHKINCLHKRAANKTSLLTCPTLQAPSPSTSCLHTLNEDTPHIPFIAEESTHLFPLRDKGQNNLTNRVRIHKDLKDVLQPAHVTLNRSVDGLSPISRISRGWKAMRNAVNTSTLFKDPNSPSAEKLAGRDARFYPAENATKACISEYAEQLREAQHFWNLYADLDRAFITRTSFNELNKVIISEDGGELENEINYNDIAHAGTLKIHRKEFTLWWIQRSLKEAIPWSCIQKDAEKFWDQED